MRNYFITENSVGKLNVSQKIPKIKVCKALFCPIARLVKLIFGRSGSTNFSISPPGARSSSLWHWIQRSKNLSNKLPRQDPPLLLLPNPSRGQRVHVSRVPVEFHPSRSIRKWVPSVWLRSVIQSRILSCDATLGFQSRNRTESHSKWIDPMQLKNNR